MAKKAFSALQLRCLGTALSLLCLLVAPSFAAATDVPTDNPLRLARDIAVDRFVQSFFQNRCHVGLSIAAVRGHNAIFYDYGSVSRTRSELPTPQSIYELASVTKTFTAMLAARAVVEGKMSVDGDFRQALPGDFNNLAWNDEPITLRTLLTHRSGMPRDIPDSDALFANKSSPDFIARLYALDKGVDQEQFLTELHATRLRSEPGRQEAYSNAGYLVIGLGLEHIYRQPMAVIVREAITQPLGMPSTVFDLDANQRRRLVTPYDRFGRVAPYHLPNAGAAWGLYSSAADMAAYVRWQLNDADPVVHRSHQVLTGSADDGMGMAWNLGQNRGQPVVWHSGGSFGMSSQMVFYPRQNEGYVLLANDACQGTEGALKSLAEALRAAF